MALTAEQIAEARSEGYTDAEILDHYAKVSGSDISAARKEGYSNAEILSHLSGAEVTPEPEAVAGPSSLSNPALSGALGAGAGAVYSAKTVPVKAAKAFGNAVASRMAPAAPTAPSPNVYTTPSGIPVEQTPGGLHPGAVGNAQFNVEQQQANTLRQNMPSGFEQKGTSRIITPVGMQEPAAALGGAPSTPAGMRAELSQAAKKAVPAVGGAARGVLTSSPVAGAVAGYNLQDALNRGRAGDTAGAVIGGVGAGTQFLPKMKGKAGLIKPVAGVGAALVNKLRGEPESVMNKAEGGRIPMPHEEHMAAGGAVQHFNGGKRALAEGIVGGAKKGYDAVKGYLKHEPQNPNPLVGTRYEREHIGNLVPKAEFDAEKHKGASIKIFPYDSTSRNEKITSVSGHELTNPLITSGGQKYIMDVAHVAANKAGASNPGIAKRVFKRMKTAEEEGLRAGGTGEVLMTPSTMGAFAENFSSMPSDIMLDLLRQRELPPDVLEMLSNQVRGVNVPGKGQIYKNFVGFGDPRLDEQLLKGGFGLETTPGELRKGVSNRLGLVENQKLLDYNLGDLTAAITDPDLVGIPKGFAGNVIARGDPRGKLTLSGHKNYEIDYPGKYLASGANMPVEFWLPKPYNAIKEELRAKRPNMNESTLHNSVLGALEKRGSGFSGILDNEVLDNYGKFQEGLKSGAFEPGDLWAIRQYMTPDNFAEGGEVKNMAGGKLTGGLGMLPMSARTELRKRGQMADRSGIPAALTMPDPAMVSAYNSAPGDLMKLAAMYANPVVGAGMTGGQMMQAASSGDYGDAALLGGLGALGVAGNIPKGVRAVRGVANSMMQNPRAPSMMDRLYNTGAADDHLQAVPAMSGGGDVAKALLKKAMGVGSRTIEGSPHTYPPIAEGPWMRDYQQTAQAAPKITYMGKYLSPTPERMAAEKAQREAAIQSAIENRKAQWLAQSRARGIPEEQIMEEMNSPWGAPWMP